MELLMPCLNTFSKVQRKKRPSEPRTSKSCTVCSPRWPMPASQALAPQSSYHHSTEFSSMEPTFYPSFDNFGIISKAGKPTKALIRSTLVEWGCGYWSCKSQTRKLEESGQKAWMSIKNSTGYCITRNYHLYLKSFEQSSSVNTTTTLWQDISASIKP